MPLSSQIELSKCYSHNVRKTYNVIIVKNPFHCCKSHKPGGTLVSRSQHLIVQLGQSNYGRQCLL